MLGVGGWALAGSADGHERTGAGLADVVGLAESTELRSAGVAVVVEESGLGWASAGVVHHGEGRVNALAGPRRGDDECGSACGASADSLALCAVLQCAGHAGISVLDLAAGTDAAISCLVDHESNWTYTQIAARKNER